MQSKTKQQQQRLQRNIEQAKNNRAELKKAGYNNRNTSITPSGSKPGGVSSSLMTKIFGRADKPTTAQQSIPYREMFRDGVCRVNDRLFTMSTPN